MMDVMKNTNMANPKDVLRHHVTGAIKRGATLKVSSGMTFLSNLIHSGRGK